MKRIHVVYVLLAALVTLLSASGCGRAAGYADDLAVPIREASELAVKEGSEAAANPAAREVAEAAAMAAARNLDSVSNNIIQHYEIPISQGPDKSEITAKLKNVMKITFCSTILYELTSEDVEGTLLEMARQKDLTLGDYGELIASAIHAEAASLQEPQRQQDLKDIYGACKDFLGT